MHRIIHNLLADVREQCKPDKDSWQVKKSQDLTNKQKRLYLYHVQTDCMPDIYREMPLIYEAGKLGTCLSLSELVPLPRANRLYARYI